MENRYIYPERDLLDASIKTEVLEENYEEEVLAINNLLIERGINGKVIKTNIGPTIVQHEIKLDGTLDIKKIQASDFDEALAMVLAKKGIRIQIPIPGKNTIGFEVPKTNRQTIKFNEIYDYKPNPLEINIGKDVNGNTINFNIKDLPHLLVGGTTGSGKTVLLNTIMANLLMNASYEQIKLVLIDPKRVEFNIYKDLPHLYLPIIKDSNKSIQAFDKLINEMENRYKLFEEVGARDIESYREITGKNLPNIIVIIDEYADLVMENQKLIEEKIKKICQKSRASGINMIIATQRPSTDIITGVIKANIPSRISLRVSSQQDSNVIIGQSGAQNLQGKGDMLFLPQTEGTPIRVQVPFVSANEIKRIVDFIVENNKKTSNFKEDKTIEPEVKTIKSKPVVKEDIGLKLLNQLLQTKNILLVKFDLLKQIEEYLNSNNSSKLDEQFIYTLYVILVYEAKYNNSISILEMFNSRTRFKLVEFFNKLNCNLDLISIKKYADKVLSDCTFNELIENQEVHIPRIKVLKQVEVKKDGNAYYYILSICNEKSPLACLNKNTTRIIYKADGKTYSFDLPENAYANDIEIKNGKIYYYERYGEEFTSLYTYNEYNIFTNQIKKMKLSYPPYFAYRTRGYEDKASVLVNGVEKLINLNSLIPFLPTSIEKFIPTFAKITSCSKYDGQFIKLEIQIKNNKSIIYLDRDLKIVKTYPLKELTNISDFENDIAITTNILGKKSFIDRRFNKILEKYEPVKYIGDGIYEVKDIKTKRTLFINKYGYEQNNYVKENKNSYICNCDSKIELRNGPQNLSELIMFNEKEEENVTSKTPRLHL